jgi:hypothetical protein
MTSACQPRCLGRRRGADPYNAKSRTCRDGVETDTAKTSRANRLARQHATPKTGYHARDPAVFQGLTPFRAWIMDIQCINSMREIDAAAPGARLMPTSAGACRAIVRAESFRERLSGRSGQMQPVYLQQVSILLFDRAWAGELLPRPDIDHAHVPHPISRIQDHPVRTSVPKCRCNSRASPRHRALSATRDP